MLLSINTKEFVLCQKPCGPKQTYADLSQVAKLLQPQKRPSEVFTSNLYHVPSEETAALSLQNQQDRSSRDVHRGRSKSNRTFGTSKLEESVQKSRSTSAGAMVEKLNKAAQKNGVRIKLVDLLKIRICVILIADMGFFMKIEGGSDRSSAPEVPAFLKKYLLQKKIGDETSEASVQSLDGVSVDRSNGAKATQSPQGLPQWVNNDMFYHLGPSESVDDKGNDQSSTVPESSDTVRCYEADCETPTTRVSEGASESVVSGIYHKAQNSLGESLGGSSYNDSILLCAPSSSIDATVKLNEDSEEVHRTLSSQGVEEDSVDKERNKLRSIPSLLQTQVSAAPNIVWHERTRAVLPADNPPEGMVNNDNANGTSEELNADQSNPRRSPLEKIRDNTSLGGASVSSALPYVASIGSNSQDFHAGFSGGPVGVSYHRNVEFIQTSIWQDSDSSDLDSLCGR